MNSYNMVLQNINVTHPCQSEEAGTSAQELAPVAPFDRAQEEARMGQFELEEGFDTVKVSHADEDGNLNFGMGMDQLQDLTMQLE